MKTRTPRALLGPGLYPYIMSSAVLMHGLTGAQAPGPYNVKVPTVRLEIETVIGRNAKYAYTVHCLLCLCWACPGTNK